jgi:hypothetical protein
MAVQHARHAQPSQAQLTPVVLHRRSCLLPVPAVCGQHRMLHQAPCMHQTIGTWLFASAHIQRCLRTLVCELMLRFVLCLASCCSLCNLGKVRLPSSSPSAAAGDRDARGPRDKNGGSGGGGGPITPGSDGSSRPNSSGPGKQHSGLPPAPVGSLAAAAVAAAGGSNGSLRSMGGKVAGRGDASLMGGDGSPLTTGVKAHAVMLSHSALSVSNM